MSNFWGAVQSPLISDDLIRLLFNLYVLYSGLNLSQDKATKPQTVQIVRQGEATPYWFKVNPLYHKVFILKDITCDTKSLLSKNTIIRLLS